MAKRIGDEGDAPAAAEIAAGGLRLVGGNGPALEATLPATLPGDRSGDTPDGIARLVCAQLGIDPPLKPLAVRSHPDRLVLVTADGRKLTVGRTA